LGFGLPAHSRRSDFHFCAGVDRDSACEFPSAPWLQFDDCFHFDHCYQGIYADSSASLRAPCHLKDQSPFSTQRTWTNPSDFIRTFLDSLWEKFRDKVVIVYPVEDFDYGMREFAIRDNNGYILQFGQEIASP